MAIHEMDGYHGRALMQIIRSDEFTSINRYDTSIRSAYVINHNTGLYVKYTTRENSPWRFSFSADEWSRLTPFASRYPRMFMLFVCGYSKFCVLDCSQFISVTSLTGESCWTEISREPGTFFRVRGNVGVLDGSVPPSAYPRRVLQ
ncbi:hypothetical protein [Alicyclobacillus macrosporangiidus]|uniref:Uncharacterized protein n=1 Tax=Alicyclobacillus macrosporangiidus TaxID=392015 RepID=A0A1I7LC59_9BACL|nr:hypothetical protein [Alicyclobacillus macrosporangiidus]SFV07297.1 hypothetical protein SAMN05421543_1357 [Alicyclobacillus macrosporangiidus]